jgi:transcriptional regulator with XRE-family HTH domain
MSHLDLTIGRNIRKCRRCSGLSAERLADRLSTTVDELRAFEAGLRRVGPLRLWQLSRALERPLSDFFSPAARSGARHRPSRAPDGLERHIKAQGLALARAFYQVGDFRARTETN